MGILTKIIRQVYYVYHDTAENERCRKAIPMDNIPDSPNTVVCERHWPSNYEYTVYRGKRRPVHPPSIFSDVPPSMIPTPPPKPRSTTIVCSSTRNILPDQQSKFHEVYVIKSFGELKSKLVDNKYDFHRFSTFSYSMNDSIIIQSVEFEQPSCIPKFLLKIFEDFTYISFHCGLR